MPSPAPLDLVFVPASDVAVDLQRLRSVLADAGVAVQRVFFACPTPTVDKRLADAVEEQGLAWESLHSDSAVQVVNRALLLGGHDALVMAEELVGFGDFATELCRVLAQHDRAGAVVATREATGATAQELAQWLEASQLPPTATLPVPDVRVVLLPRLLRGMVGTLDETLGGLGDALADWSLRAQRLGFVTLRATRALVRASPFSPAPELPASPVLVERHPYYAAQREAAVADFALSTPARAMASARGQLSVCLDIRYLPEDAVNGTSVYAVELSRALTAHTPTRVTFCVATERQREALAPLGLPVRLQGEGVPADAQLLHRPAQVFRTEDLALLLRSPVPYLLTYQDLIAYRAGSVWADGAAQARYQLTSYVAVRAAQGLIAISEHNRQEILREFGVAADSVHTVHHGVDAAAFARTPGEDVAAVLRPLQLPRRFFLFIGSDYAHKNVKLLLAAYANFRAQWRQREDTPGLVMVGHPSGTRDGVLPHLRQRPMPGVHYVGGVSSEVLRALYHQAIAYVYLSAYEGFGLPLLEAMAAETPILCSRFSSIPEVAGDAALYAEQMDDASVAAQMVALASTPELGRSLVARGRERVAAFTWKKTAQGTYEAYRAALQRPAAASLVDRRWLTALASQPLLP